MCPASEGVINSRLRRVASPPQLPYKEDEQGTSQVRQQMYLSSGEVTELIRHRAPNHDGKRHVVSIPAH